MTNLLSVWTPHAASLSRAFCMFYYLFKQNTQPAKMAKAMNSFGFPPLHLSLSVTPPLHSTLCWLIECT